MSEISKKSRESKVPPLIGNRPVEGGPGKFAHLLFRQGCKLRWEWQPNFDFGGGKLKEKRHCTTYVRWQEAEIYNLFPTRNWPQSTNLFECFSASFILLSSQSRFLPRWRVCSGWRWSRRACKSPRQSRSRLEEGGQWLRLWHIKRHMQVANYKLTNHWSL